MRSNALLITCEHGGNRIPVPYRFLFRDHKDLLESHRGYDAGALLMARELADLFGVPLVFSEVSRLLVDLNRSIGNAQLHCDAVWNASARRRREILACYYIPYRAKTEQYLTTALVNGSRVVHVSSHSFTPELNGKLRNADVGLLYDPSRQGEVELCALWKQRIVTCAPTLKVRRNYPYAGKGDGFTRYFRGRFNPKDYIGVELEINQKFVLEGGARWTALRKVVGESLHLALITMGFR
jgi:predicted N-formylglutamate amidohydrolase